VTLNVSEDGHTSTSIIYCFNFHMRQVLRERYGVRCMLGLTATATMTTAMSVSYHLGITDHSEAIVRGAPIPPNIKLAVSRDEHRDEVFSLYFSINKQLEFLLFLIYFKTVIIILQ